MEDKIIYMFGNDTFVQRLGEVLDDANMFRGEGYLVSVNKTKPRQRTIQRWMKEDEKHGR